MISTVKQFRSQYTDLSYTIFRVLVGILFLFHGLQKTFGMFTDKGPQPLASLLGAAGIIETIGGILIILGLFTTATAVLAAIEMVCAFFIAHFTTANPIPLLNRGELPLLYFAAFLYIAFHSGGKWSLDRHFWK